MDWNRHATGGDISWSWAVRPAPAFFTSNVRLRPFSLAMLIAVLVGGAFLLAAVRPRASMPAVTQLVVATVALAVSAIVAEEIRLLWLVAALALETVIVAGLSRRAWRERTGCPGCRKLLLLAGVGVVPWLAYALHMCGR